jgi:Replication-relaxation
MWIIVGSPAGIIRSSSLCKRRERVLVITITTVASIMQKQVYALGSEARPLLVEQRYAPRDFAERRLRHNELTEIGIRHSLFVPDIHTRVLLLTRSGPITLAYWHEGSALWDSVVPRRDDPAIPIRPDAYFVLEHCERSGRKNKFHVFLEADRSTMSHERMATKVAGYVAYYEQGAYREKYRGMRAFIVATVTQTHERAEELRKDLHPLVPHAASRDAYLFIPFEDLTLQSLLPRAAASAA